jgi:N utilization substance protein B
MMGRAAYKKKPSTAIRNTNHDEPPAKVIIREYLDIAHGFFTAEEPRFAAGVLDALARSLRPGDFPA